MVGGMNRTLFISSTFEDLQDHRRQVWNILTEYDVNIRGMERFGARKEAPLQTCLTEVEQSDIFVCIISCCLGTIDKKSAKSFVQCEYEKALKLDKEIFIYLIDTSEGNINPKHVDFGEKHEKLEAFKSILKERHTIDTFKDAGDLAEKLKRKFEELLTKKDNQTGESIDEYQRTKELLEKFLVLPSEYSGKEVKLRVKLDEEPFPASKAICDSFYLSYGSTIGVEIKIIKPDYKGDAFNYLFIDHREADEFFKLDKKKEVDIYAAMKFTEATVDSIRARFVSRSYVTLPASALDVGTFGVQNAWIGQTRTEPAEGHIILQLRQFIKQENKEPKQPTKPKANATKKK